VREPLPTKASKSVSVTSTLPGEVDVSKTEAVKLPVIAAAVEHLGSGTSSPRLSVVVPAYNEAARLEPTLKRIVEFLERRKETWQLLVSDDGSTDGSPERIAESGLPVEMIRGTHRGKGAAVKRGVVAAEGQLILFTDADLSTPIEELERLEEAIELGNDLAIGSRSMPESRILTPQSRHRILLGWVFRRLVRALGLPGIKDSQCGFKLFKADAAQDIFGRCSIRGFAFDAEVLMLAQERGYRVAEVGVAWADAKGSKVSPLWHSAQMLRDVALARSRLSKQADDADQVARRAWSLRRRTLRTLIVLNIAGTAWWLAWLLDPRHAANVVLYGLLLVAQALNLFQIFGYWHSIWHLRPPQRRPGGFATAVDVMITTYDEPLEIIERTVKAAVTMQYPHRTLVLDDGRREEVAAIARRLGAEWMTRPENNGAKAGNLNHALSQTDAPFLAVFDADHAPHREFLSRVMPFFRDHRLAWVQVPQYYTNRHRSYMAGAAMDQQMIFFGPICEGQDGRNAVLCCGTNFVMRRHALEQVGGFREDTVTEDAATGLELHARGWRSRYLSEQLADGLAPEDLGAYMSQQRRWAMGNLEMLFRHRVFRKELTPNLMFQYAWASSHYLAAVPSLIYVLLPALFLGFGVETVATTTNDDFIVHFLPFIVATLLIFGRSVDGRLRFRAIQLSHGMFPVYLAALVSVLLRRRVRFEVTPKVGTSQSFYKLVTPQLVAIALILATTAVGFVHYSGPRTITNACWSLFNAIMLVGVVRAAAPVTLATPAAEARNTEAA
jgi:cellulose synthase (UDP-forming)